MKVSRSFSKPERSARKRSPYSATSTSRRTPVATLNRYPMASRFSRCATRASRSFSGKMAPTGSTQIRIVPPQANPTENASPSDTPYSNKRGCPSSIASSASATTAPSTHPPETDPAISPAPLMANNEPVRRGALPQVSTTVAKAAPLPSRCHFKACSGISSKRFIAVPSHMRG